MAEDDEDAEPSYEEQVRFYFEVSDKARRSSASAFFHYHFDLFHKLSVGN